MALTLDQLVGKYKTLSLTEADLEESGYALHEVATLAKSSMAKEPSSEKEDRDRNIIGLMKNVSEDPSMSVAVDEESDQIIVSGMGESHLEIIIDRPR